MQWSSGPVKVARKPTTTHQRRKVIPPLLPYPDMEKIHSSQRGVFLRMTASPHSASQPVEAVELSEETLRVLRQQRSLSLCGRQILSIRHIRHLEYMINLQSLNMHMNLLRQVDGLATLRQLVELDLSANELQALGETNCFDGLIQLRRLNLSSNLLRTIHANVWLPLTSLEWLSLGFNLLEDISGLCTLPSQLQYVDVCGNCLDNLDHVEKALAPHRQSLRELRISNPQLAATGIFPFVASNANTSSGLLRENPCCDWISPTGESCAERLLAVFDRLTALNGVVVGVDALAEVLSAVEVSVPIHSHASIPRDEISASEWVPAAAVAASPKQHSPVAAAVRRRSSETKDRQGKHKHRGRTPGVDWSRSIQHVTPSPTCSRTSSRLRVATPPNTLVGATPTRPPSSRVDRAAAAQAVVRTPLGIDASIGSATERVPGRKVSIAVGTDERPVGPLFTPKCVSRRVNTEVSLMGAVDVGQSATNSSRGTPPEASVVLAVEDLSSVESVTDHIQHQEVEMLELRVKRMSEQLLLRIAMEEDLRRTLQLSQQRSQSDLAAQESRVYQLQTQVMALKDEMTRKAQEVAIMNRKNKAEMEWQAQRLSAQHAAELGKKNAALAEVSAANDKMVASHSRRCQEVQDEAAQLRERQTELLSRVKAALLEVDVQSRATAHANMRTKAAQHALQVQRLEYDELRSRSCLWQENLIPMLHMTIHFWKSRWLSSNREHHKQLISWQQNQQTWEEYAVSQQTQYTDAIQHAQQEAERWYSALQAVQAEALVKQQVVHAETQTRDAEASEGDSTVADLRLMCECLKSEVTRLRESSTLVEAAHTRLAEENTRLLARIEERRGDECTNHERENFLRTIRNLEKDIQNKDSSLAELEAEAHAKLDSKRERIAALENQVEDLLSRVEKATESSVKYRDQLDALERSSAPSRDEVARWKGQYERLCEEYKKQESRVMMQEEQLTTLRSRESTLLGERTTLVSALSRARDQLVQEHAAHASVLSQHQCCSVALAKKDADLAELKRSYDAALSTSRAKHRAALSALSQLMEGDEVAT